jgi:hypothetical protein
MATNKKPTRKKLAPVVREIIVKEGYGNDAKVQPLGALANKTKTPTNGWRSQLLFPDAIAHLLESI